MHEYDVKLHFKIIGLWWAEYAIPAECTDGAKDNALAKLINKAGYEFVHDIDCVRVYKRNTNRLLKEYNI